MNAAQLKFLQMFADFARIDINDTAAVEKQFKSFLNQDYSRAVDLWDYVLATYESKLTDPKVAQVFGVKLYKLFKAKSAPKAQKLLLDDPYVRRAIFQYGPNYGDGEFFNLVVDLCVMNKTAQAEEIFKCAVKNTNSKQTFGAYMQSVVERLFIEILKRSTSKRVEMSRKLSALLLNYIAKIKTDERAMLEQRIKELM